MHEVIYALIVYQELSRFRSEVYATRRYHSLGYVAASSLSVRGRGLPMSVNRVTGGGVAPEIKIAAVRADSA